MSGEIHKVKCVECGFEYVADQGPKDNTVFICLMCMGTGFDPKKYAKKSKREEKLEEALLTAISYWMAHVKVTSREKILSSPYFRDPKAKEELNAIENCLDALKED